MWMKREEPSTGNIFAVSAGALVADQEIQDQDSEVEHQHPVTWIQRKSHRFGQGAHVD